MKVLIAEDEAVSRKLLENTLKQWGYEVIAVENGRKAWEIVQQEGAPRLLILDWMMPEMDGIEVIHHIRSREDPLYSYVILLTSKNERKDIVEGLSSGADDYLAKPFDSNELKQRILVGRRILELLSELSKAREMLARKASIDSLTSLYNRGAILELLEKEIYRAKREKSLLGLIMLDLDHFKRVNDTFGHMAGDAILREAAKRVAKGIRPYDYAGRYGGEEFLIIMPGCNFVSTRSRAEEILRQIRSPKMNIPEAILQVTASIGYVSTELIEDYNPRLMVQMADSALYEAKSSGRDRIASINFFRNYKIGGLKPTNYHFSENI
ncbi:MAG: diguanylate cyclase [Deltaproteobacteria bacterium]|nr:diguanylate cyclase [Deltaproteobacteria bacterium]